MIETMSGEVLRQRTIENADQLGTQAETMAATIEDAASRFAEVASRLALLAAETEKTLEKQQKDGVPFDGTIKLTVATSAIP